jgi:hypothetical protein
VLFTLGSASLLSDSRDCYCAVNNMRCCVVTNDSRHAVLSTSGRATLLSAASSASLLSTEGSDTVLPTARTASCYQQQAVFLYYHLTYIFKLSLRRANVVRILTGGESVSPRNGVADETL